jgi:hypothetical protein
MGKAQRFSHFLLFKFLSSNGNSQLLSKKKRKKIKAASIVAQIKIYG